jgi:transcription elongation GreA/GreB family factor
METNRGTGVEAAVSIGSRVRLRDHEGDFECVLVDAHESDPASLCVSLDSALGRALLGRQPGERVIVASPVGSRPVVILEVR